MNLDFFTQDLADLLGGFAGDPPKVDEESRHQAASRLGDFITAVEKTGREIVVTAHGRHEGSHLGLGAAMTRPGGSRGPKMPARRSTEPDLRTVGDIGPDALTLAENSDPRADEQLTTAWFAFEKTLTPTEWSIYLCMMGSNGEYFGSDDAQGLSWPIHYDDWKALPAPTQDALRAVLKQQGKSLVLGNVGTIPILGPGTPREQAARRTTEWARVLGWEEKKVQNTMRAVHAKATKAGLKLPD